LRSITHPALVLWGEDDTNFQPVEEAKTRAALMPHTRFEIVSGGHEPWFDDVEACSRLIAVFHSSHVD
jgi:pimeloyl-ACP methyl ester carboxylesterase